MPGEEINVREYRRRNEKWDNPEKKARGKNQSTTQYVLDTTLRKQTQITQIRHEHYYTQLDVKTNRSTHNLVSSS